MSQQTMIKKAWRWSVLHSPLLGLWRWGAGFGRPNRLAEELIREAQIPDPVTALILTTIRRTKLWASEREQVARELIAHAQDALDAGRSEDEIIASFGKPRVVARLMRRSMKRKRPLAWQAYRFTRRAAGVMAVLLIVGYGVLAARFYGGRPSVKTNYIAQLDARNTGYSEDQKSWPVLAELGLKWNQISWELSEQQRLRVIDTDRSPNSTGMSLFPDVDQSHPDYEEIVQAVRGFSEDLPRLRQAASRPIFGIPVGFEMNEVERNGRTWTTGIIPASKDEYLEHSAIEVLLPNLGPASALSRLLVFDAKLSMAQSDPERATDDFAAAMGLARQCKREPFLISRLVGIGIHDLVTEHVIKAFETDPGAFSADQLTRLAHLNALLASSEGMGFGTEGSIFDDLLQRLYTDDGKGDGHLTAEGLEWYRSFIPGYQQQLPSANLGDMLNGGEQIQAIMMPISLVTSSSRKQESERYHGHLDSIQRVLREGPESIWMVSDMRAEQGHIRSGQAPMRFSLAAITTPAFGRSVSRYFVHQQTANAFGVMLAIECYRFDHGQLPDTLAQLVPLNLPSVPEDLMDPGQPIKYARAGDGYLLYSTGSDGDDDGGVAAAPHPGTDQRSEVHNFIMRYTPKYSSDGSQMLLDAANRPILTATGPDGDWILIDMRPEGD